ncbi:MAG: type I toxin-antitoxin system SymE family toxin [Candidatus Roizmanbacteria bacterium]|nr:type I toxin-antitoxin system SymE family toxin [Candidatus Roizmanbacteria bacterium]
MKVNLVGYLVDENFNRKPFIRLSGKWLEEAGFNIGKEYGVTILDSKLILESLNE